MAALDLMLKAGEWGAEVVKASNNNAQRRSADVVEKSAILVAGLQHMDKRFTELFVPLVFFDPGSWPLERRRAWAEDALSFIHGDRVVDRLGQAIIYLESAPADDPHLAVLVQDLCDVTHVALWGDLEEDVSSPPPRVEPEHEQDHPEWWSWADNVRYRNQYRDAPAPWDSDRTAYGRPREFLDPDDMVAPTVSILVTLMRSDDPDREQVQQAASACLAMPRDVGSRTYMPPAPRQRAEQANPVNPFEDAAELRAEHRTARLPLDELQSLDHPSYGGHPSHAVLDNWPVPLNTVSPLRDFADIAGRRFQQILAVVRTSFPGLPEPAWLWGSGT